MGSAKPGGGRSGGARRLPRGCRHGSRRWSPGVAGSRGEVQVPAAAVLVRQPLGDLRGLVRGQVVQHDVHGKAARDGGVDLFEEPQHVFGGMTLLAVRQHLTGRDVHRREQVGRAVALVVVGHRAGPARDHRQAWLGAVDRLALGLLIEAEHHRPLGRVQVQPDDIDELGLELRGVGDLERADLPGLEVVVGPDLGDRVFAEPEPLGQQPGRPVRPAVVRLVLAAHPDDLGDRALGQRGLAAPSLGDLPDAVHALLGKPSPPAPDRVGRDLAAAGDLLVGHPITGPQHSLCLQHLPVRQRRDAAIGINSARWFGRRRCGSPIAQAGCEPVSVANTTVLPR